MNEVVSEAFVRFFVEIVGHYSLFLTSGEERSLQREAFRKAVSSKSLRRFLEVFMETQTFRGFIQERELRRQDAKGRNPTDPAGSNWLPGDGGGVYRQGCRQEWYPEAGGEGCRQACRQEWYPGLHRSSAIRPHLNSDPELSLLLPGLPCPSCFSAALSALPSCLSSCPYLGTVEGIKIRESVVWWPAALGQRCRIWHPATMTFHASPLLPLL